jgi:hypothetical protein
VFLGERPNSKIVESQVGAVTDSVDQLNANVGIASRGRIATFKKLSRCKY